VGHQELGNQETTLAQKTILRGDEQLFETLGIHRSVPHVWYNKLVLKSPKEHNGNQGLDERGPRNEERPFYEDVTVGM
jgi:hypothetical protein